MVMNYYKNGKLQMKATYLSLDPEIKDGICTWYFKSRSVCRTANYSMCKTDGFYYFQQSNWLNNAYKYSLKNKSIDSLQNF
jgi:antitoxin component YwqK of YwqJK toxin-antitoxin module